MKLDGYNLTKQEKVLFWIWTWEDKSQKGSAKIRLNNKVKLLQYFSNLKNVYISKLIYEKKEKAMKPI